MNINKNISLKLIAFSLMFLVIGSFCVYRVKGAEDGSGAVPVFGEYEQDLKIENEEKKVRFEQFDGEIYARNVHVIQKDPLKIEVRLNENALIRIKYSDGRTIVYDGFSNERINLGESSSDAKIILDEKGIKEAYLKAAKEGDYEFGNNKIHLKRGDIFILKDEKAIVQHSESGKINYPELIDEKKQGYEFTFRHPEKGYFELENGDKFSGADLKYKDEILYFYGEDKVVSIGNWGKIINPEGTKIYLDFDGKVNPDYGAAYISYDKAKGVLVTGSNINERGPAIALEKNNPFGYLLKENDHFAFQSLGNPAGSYVKITNRDKEGKVPLRENLNQWVVNQDAKSVYYHSQEEKLFIRPKATIIKDLGSGSSTVPEEVRSYKTDENGKTVSISKYGNILGIAEEGEIGYGPNPSFIVTGASHYGTPEYMTGGGDVYLMRGFSNLRLYYNMKNAQDFQNFFGNRIRVVDQAGIMNNPKNVRILTDIVAAVPKIQQDAIKTIILESWAGYSGMAESGGIMHLNVGRRGGIVAAVARHEMGHLLDFVSGNNFENEWPSIGANRGPHTWDYGYTTDRWGRKWETKSTLAEYAYKSDAVWKSFLDTNNPNHKSFRGQVAVFTRYGFFNAQEGARILKAGGWNSDPASLVQYIKEAQEFYQSKRW